MIQLISHICKFKLGQANQNYMENYFLTPSVLFLSLIWLLWHFLHLSEDIGFFAPHLKQILKYSLRCWAICFLTVSVIGICTKINKINKFLPFYLDIAS